MNAPARITLIGFGTLTGAVLLAHGAWILLVAIATALDETEEPA